MIPDNYTVLVVGDQRTGMFEFCCYLGASYLRAGEHLVFVSTSTSPDSIRRQMIEFGVNAYDCELDDKLAIVDCYSRDQVQINDITIRVRDINNLEEILERITEGIMKVGGGPIKVVFHALTPLYMEHEGKVMEEFFDALSSLVRISGCMTCSVHRETLSNEHIAELCAASDGVLEMMVDESYRRFVRIRQFRGMRVSPKWVPFDFERDENVAGTMLTWKPGR